MTLLPSDHDPYGVQPPFSRLRSESFCGKVVNLLVSKLWTEVAAPDFAAENCVLTNVFAFDQQHAFPPAREKSIILCQNPAVKASIFLADETSDVAEPLGKTGDVVERAGKIADVAERTGDGAPRDRGSC